MSTKNVVRFALSGLLVLSVAFTVSAFSAQHADAASFVVERSPDGFRAVDDFFPGDDFADDAFPDDSFPDDASPGDDTVGGDDAVEPPPAPPATDVFVDQGGPLDALTNKLLVHAKPGQVISHHVIDGDLSNLTTQQILALVSDSSFNGSQVGNESKPLEFFLPLSAVGTGPNTKNNVIVSWTEQDGLKLIDTLVVPNRFPDSELWPN